ncbi:MAG: hypothetical protein ACLFUR_06580 [Candidatus Hadarchaeia archaeon]
MPTASAKGVREYLKLKGVTKAKGFQRIRAEEWLDRELKRIPISEE